MSDRKAGPNFGRSDADDDYGDNRVPGERWIGDGAVTVVGMVAGIVR
jgi:hypothetical protein